MSFERFRVPTTRLLAGALCAASLVANVDSGGTAPESNEFFTVQEVSSDGRPMTDDFVRDEMRELRIALAGGLPLLEETVAIVPFGSASINDAELLATNFETAVEDAAPGLIDMRQVDVVVPAKAARSRYIGGTSECMGGSVKDGRPSQVVREVMGDEVDNYSFVVAVNEAIGCEGVAGLSSTQEGLGDADVYGFSEEKLQSISRQTLASVVAHEVLHRRLGHAGKLSYENYDLFRYYEIGMEYPTFRINVHNYVQRSSYNEYGEQCNVMANECIEQTEVQAPPLHLNALQKKWLRGELTADGIFTSSNDGRIGISAGSMLGSATSFTVLPDMVAEDDVYWVTSDKPFDLPGGQYSDINSLEASQRFDSLAFVPYSANPVEFEWEVASGFQVYIFNSTGSLLSTIDLGRISDSNFEFDLGSNLVSVSFDPEMGNARLGLKEPVPLKRVPVDEVCTVRPEANSISYAAVC